MPILHSIICGQHIPGVWRHLFIRQGAFHVGPVGDLLLQVGRGLVEHPHIFLGGQAIALARLLRVVQHHRHHALAHLALSGQPAGVRGLGYLATHRAARVPAGHCALARVKPRGIDGLLPFQYLKAHGWHG